jgi:uncharacterized membrane-anchored protein
VAVVLISVVGTLIADNITDLFHVPLQVTTAIFAVVLAAVFAVWYANEKTLSIHTIVTRRRELFYWAAILVTFALGTAAGDLVAETMQLGYLNSALAFGATRVASVEPSRSPRTCLFPSESMPRATRITRSPK